jgi:hypothetical protein
MHGVSTRALLRLIIFSALAVLPHPAATARADSLDDLPPGPGRDVTFGVCT